MGAAAAGESGVAKAFDILRRELSVALGQLGISEFDAVDGSLLFQSAKSEGRRSPQSR